MAERSTGNRGRRLFGLSNDDPRKALLVAALVSLVCALAVSVTAVALKPIQLANIERERQARMTEMIARLPGMEEILRTAGADSLETHAVALESGTFAPEVDTATFDQRAAANDPGLSIALPADTDIAGIKRRANYALVFFLVKDGEPLLTILPVHGAGYQSTLYGYIALKPDLNTIAALTFFEQGETPGLGANISEPNWQVQWGDKQVADETGEIRIRAVRGAEGPFEVDAISGATRTSNGVTSLLRFWLGEFGFGPFLDNLKRGNI
ncbi:MAG: NADH:ubiquinone reductase (Na(+)-transporting) subunit C [Alphaproteobacteria bacterium]